MLQKYFDERKRRSYEEGYVGSYQHRCPTCQLIIFMCPKLVSLYFVLCAFSPTLEAVTFFLQKQGDQMFFGEKIVPMDGKRPKIYQDTSFSILIQELLCDKVPRI
jgi:hypothetical protein